mgnify:CR=1 FL=1
MFKNDGGHQSPFDVQVKSPAIPCRFPGPCPYRYFGGKCMHRQAKDGVLCPSAYKVVK